MEAGNTLNIYSSYYDSSCKLIVNDNKSETAAIGGGNETSTGTINIYDGTITANGAKYGAGIGGGDECDGGKINIYGGNITANGGKWGAGIGAGGRYDDASYFNGKITISGGDIEAHAGYSTSDHGAYYVKLILDKAIAIGVWGGKGSGTLKISGGTIDAYTGTHSYYIGSSTYCSTAMAAPNVTIIDPKNGGLSVSTLEDKNTFAKADDRINYLTKKVCKGIHIESCTHKGDSTCENLTDTTHTVNCAHCGNTLTLDHTFDKPTWTWNDDYSKATALFTCTDCNKQVSVDAKITDSTSNGVKTYTATATIGGNDYTDSRNETLCNHENVYYRDITDTTHTKVCPDCLSKWEEKHSYPNKTAKWDWNEDYTKVTLTLTCEGCGHTITSTDAKVAKNTYDTYFRCLAIAQVGNSLYYTDTGKIPYPEETDKSEATTATKPEEPDGTANNKENTENADKSKATEGDENIEGENVTENIEGEEGSENIEGEEGNQAASAFTSDNRTIILIIIAAVLLIAASVGVYMKKRKG